MKEYKERILKALEEESKKKREFRFYDVCKNLGFKHLKRNDVAEITSRFIKRNPSYKRFIFTEENKMYSLFMNCVLTELEYD